MSFDWIISDTHFGHVRIVEYEPIRKTWCDGTVEGMTEALIAAWQRVVQPHHRVLHLGDFAMGPKARWAEMRARLPGQITLIRGNHDPEPGSKHWDLLRPIEVADELEFDHPQLGRVLCAHDPSVFSAEDADRFDVLLHGHLHSGHHRDNVPESIRAKCICASVERLPSQPAPLPFDLLLSLRTEASR